MRKNSFGETVILVMMVIGIFLLVGMICDESAKNKCILKGCDNKRAPGSSYCYLHKSYGKTSSGSYTKSSGTKSSGASSNSTSGYSNSYKKSSGSYSGSKTGTSGGTYSGSKSKNSGSPLAAGMQLVEKEHFAKLNKFAGKKEFSQKASPCANLFLNQRGRGTLTVPSHTLPPSEGVGSYVYRQTEGRCR